MASIAVLPILIGLAVDYAIQFQSRVAGGAATSAGQRAPARSPAPRGPARRRSPPPRSPPPPASSCCCSRRCRWCAASGCCWSSASRSRSCARSPPARRRSCSPSASASGGSVALAARRRGASCARRRPAPAILAAPRGRATPGRERRCRLGRARRRAAAPRGRSPAWPAPSACSPWRRVLAVLGLGRRHPDLGPVRRHQARAVEHAGAARPAHARAGDRRLRRDRRDRPRHERRHARRRSAGCSATSSGC